MSPSTSPFRLLPLVLAASLIAAMPPPASAQQSLQLDGVNDYITFGSASGLGATSFTIEVAFQRTAAGVTASTGTGGVTAVPLITKGRGEADGANTDMNWFLGINAANQLTADYEEGAGQASPGLNHPITGTTVITNNVWHHAAAVFDGTTWSLYLDGNLDATLVVGAGRLPRFDSIQHAALGSALTSTGASAGFFAGLLDEARVWNVARTQAQIQAGIGAEILQATGLLGRWGLNEGAGAGAGNSVAGGVNGTLTNGPVWSANSSVPLATATGVRLGGSNAYVALGNPASLQLSAFTIELWIRRDGAGVGTNTGSGGIPDAIPLVAKGRAEAETATQDINYLFGIRASDGVLCADFEEGAGGASPSLNHPVAGVTPITAGVWHHVAATYDGTTWKLYLDGALESSLAVGRPLASASIAPVAVGSALTSVGAAAGFFDGIVDEVRIWNLARTQAEIITAANNEIAGSASGLVGRWGMNEDQGVVVASSAGTTLNGTLTGTAWGWAAGSPFTATLPSAPADPTNLAATAASPTAIDLSWTDNASNETGFEVERSTTGAGGPFTPLVSLPANATSTSDTGLSAATEYCYRVRAVNGVGPSGYAATSCATTLSVPPPADPTNLTATALSPVQIDLAWTDNAANETGYEVERSTTGPGGPFTLLIALPANAVSYSNTGLGASTEFCYRVRAVNGPLASGYAAVACATTLPAPAGPTGLAASAVTSGQIHLAWTDNAADETGYAVERSVSGSGGPFVLASTLAANAVSWDDLNRDASTEFCYRVRALGAYVSSDYSAVACATTPASVPGSLDLAGSTYVTFGDPNALDLAAFTLECWFRRDGVGTTTTTGAGGIAAAVPLVTHGAPEADNSNVDMNYFMGLRSDGVLCADFEEGPGGPSPGLNHPVAGTTPVAAGSGWHHAAATYDGTTWNLYLDGNLEATLAVGRPVRSNSIQRAALGTALTSTGATNGFFDGAIDEARVWSVARSQTEIQATANAQLASAQTGLAARWSLDEGTGTIVNSSAGTEAPGTVTGVNYSWAGPAPFSLSFTTPGAPSGLTASAATQALVALTWNDNSANESSFQIERSTSGSGGPFSPLVTLPANTTSYSDGGLDPSTEYCYRVRAANGNGSSAYDGPACATTPFSTNTGLDFGNGGYASFGNASALQLSTFTIEMWMRRDGAGTGTNTGTGGIPDLVPLFAKGRAEAEAAAQDINYIFGIRASDGVLCADFEEGAAGASPSLNHPIAGATPIGTGSWHHVAATYDGSTWKLYLDGNLDASLTVGQPVAAASTVAASLASALLSTGAAAGFFDGAVDEVRVWNTARTQEQIQSTANVPIETPETGLVARWSLNEGYGASFPGSAGTSVTGTLMGSPYTWDGGAPFNLALNHAPDAPVATAPANGAVGVSTAPTLSANVADPDGNPLQVAFYGRPESGTPGPDFTIIGVPDTQYYTGQLNGGTNAIFQSQTNWIVANRAALNIAYVATLGDCVEHGDNSGNDVEWQRADASYSIVENPVTTGLLHGIPYGVTVGNHDQSPIGNPDGTTTYYNQYFGSSRFSGRSYYGGHYGANNDNWYDLFSAGGMDFLVISLEYDPTPDPAVMAWVDNLLTTNASRKAIVLSHFIVNTGNPAGFGPQGQAIYDAFKGHPNFSLMLCGHVPGEGRRQDTWLGNTVHTLMADYQGRTNGGNGWLRILQFSPANNTLRVRTYSPLLDQYEADADSSSQFTLTYPMTTTPAFALIGTSGGVVSGGTASVTWPGLSAGATYEWYATANDGAATTVGTVSRFSTAAAPTYTLATAVSPTGGGTIVRNPDQPSYTSGASVEVTATPATGHHFLDWAGDLSGSANPQTVTMDANKSVTAQFAIDTFAITASAGAGGAISPAGDVSVNYGSDQAFTITPAVGYHVTDVLVDGISLGAVGTYTFTGVTTGHTIAATFAIDTFTITASAGPGGSIDPSGTVNVGYGSDQAFTIAPTVGHHVADVKVDGSSVGAVGTYTFPAVAAAHTIEATFAIDTFTITASAGPGGSIDPSGDVSVDYGSDPAFTITPAVGYHVLDVLVDGVSVGAVGTYTFSSVTAGHTISASFAVNTYTITASAGTGGSISPSGGVTVNYGAGQTFTITPNTGFHIADVLVDGASVGATGAYPFTSISGNHTIAAMFAIDTFTITATLGAGGAISPAGNVSVDYGSDQAFTITPAVGYHVADVLVDGVSMGAVGTYTFTGVTAGHTIAASFAIDTFAITASAGAGGSIDPSGTVNVSYGTDQSFTITPAVGYHVADVKVDGGSIGAVGTYMFTAVAAAHTIEATFAIDTFTISASAGSGGSISPSGDVSVDYGADRTFTITPATGYHVTDVLVDGSSVGPVTSHTFSAISGNHTIAAAFAIDTFTIATTAGSGGSISPSGDVSVAYGSDQAFTITPTVGYHVADVLVDGASVGAVGTYTFSSVTGGHTIAASFALDTYTITASAGAGGSISPSGDVMANYGADQTFTIAPDAGYHIADVLVDGASVGALGTYPFTAVSGNHTIAATFAIDTFTITASAAAGGSISPSGDVSVSYGTDRSFTITPATGYHIADVQVDGVSIGMVGAYTFTSVTAGHTIAATFALDNFTIAAFAGAGGSIDPAGDVAVGYGLNQTFTITPDPGYHVLDLLVDGSSVGAVTSYTFTSVTGDHSIAATFELSDALDFAGTNAYAGFGNAAALKLSTFTIEMWMRRDGTGAGTNTGTGGIADLVPLLAKGRAEAEDPLRDINYIFGIRSSTGVLGADFEEAAAPSPNPSLNHPVLGATPLAIGTWYHVAATYDGATWRLYVNGAQDAELAVGRAVASTSNVAVSLASALNSTEQAAGFFDGRVDEVRVWSTARTATQIASTINAKLAAPVAGLVARWGLDEGSGAAIQSTAGTSLPGALTGSGYTWSAGAPFGVSTVTVTASAGPGGAIDPAGSVPVIPGATPSFSITPDACHDIADVLVDGASVGAVSSFTFPPVSGSAHTITASFSLMTFTVTASAGPNGSVSPAGPTAVGCGADQAYTIAADPGYHVGDVLVDGASVGAVTTYTFTGVVATHTIAATFAANGDALALAGTDGYVLFGNPPALKLNAFTIEMWLKRDGTGVGTNTGSGGIVDLVPLFAKGRADVEDPLRDINYIVGVQASTGVLGADFEEAAVPSPNPSLNHPVLGTTPLTIGTWYHVAATYDGATWRLYVNGNLDAQLAVGRGVASASDAPVTLGTAMTTAVPAAGFFQGVTDEVRVWSIARTQAEILATINDRIAAPATGLVARWGLDEGAGTLVQSTAGTPLDGAVAGTGWTWSAGAPFDVATPNPPSPPANFTAEGVSSSRIDLTWTDGSDNETGFEIERSTTGSGGVFTPLVTAGANTTAYSNTGLAPGTEYCYRIRAVNGSGSSAYDGPVCTTTEIAPLFALSFNGSTYVNLGDPAALDLPQFTLETWFRRDGAGTTVSTGAGGITDAIPLVTHGTSEADASNVDENFFLGIKSAGSVLCADFEEGAGGSSPGLNHPILGVTPIVSGVWYHAAATYDGTTWKLYLNGNLESQLAVGQPVQSATIQLAALASSIRSNGTAQGFFVGALDETRVWSSARTQSDIQGTINAQIAVPTPGLVARWALDEGSGTTVNGTAGTTVNGSISGTAYAWIAGAPFDLAFNLPPGVPALVAPADQLAGVGLTPTLQVSAADPDGQSLTFQFYGRSAVSTTGTDFTIVGMPDTQYYTGELNGGTNAILLSQTSWITANRASRSIGYVATLGDCAEHGDNGGNDIEWQHADAGYSLIENPLTTGLPEGLPYGITVGNHDQSPNGNPDGATTVFYNQYFGVNRFSGRAYYGGHYGTNNDNWFNLFSAGGMDFVVISLEYDTTPDAVILDWADGLLTTYANRRAIVLSHNFIGTGNPGTFSAQGQATYDRLKTHPNLFLMLCGHVPGEGRRSDTFNGNTVYTVMSDYQGRTNGGNGWLRVMEFSPSNNVIHVRTYSPWLDQFETDADSQFDLPYTMSGAQPFALLGTVPDVMSGGTASLTLDGLAGGTPYQWYVTVSDGVATATGPTWGFTTHSITGVDEQPVAAFSMRMTSSNPTSSGASLAFELPSAERVRVELFDAAGRRVETLADAEYPTGRHMIRWSGRTPHGQAPSGVYFVRFRAPGHVITRRFVLVR